MTRKKKTSGPSRQEVGIYDGGGENPRAGGGWRAGDSPLSLLLPIHSSALAEQNKTFGINHGNGFQHPRQWGNGRAAGKADLSALFDSFESDKSKSQFFRSHFREMNFSGAAVLPVWT